MKRLPDDSRDHADSGPGSTLDDTSSGNGCFAVAMATAAGACIATFGVRWFSRSFQGGFDSTRLSPFESMIAPVLTIALGVVLVVSAARQVKRSHGRAGAVIVLLSSAAFGLWVGSSSLSHHPSPAVAHRAACGNNVKQIALVLRMYAWESDDRLLPPLSNEPGRLMFANDRQSRPPLYPEFMTDLSILYCPAASEVIAPGELSPARAFDDHAYFYLGYQIANQEELEAFAEDYRKSVGTGGAFEGDIMGQVTTLQRLRLPEKGPGFAFRPEDAEALSLTPIHIERPLAHLPGGSNVLYLDGHVEFIKMNTKWPVTQEAMDVLLELDGLGNEPQAVSHVE